MAFDSEIAALRAAVVARLTSFDDLAGVTILGREVGQIANEIARGVASIKLLGVVHIPSAVPKGFQSKKPMLDPVRVTIRWVEDVTNNDTGKSVAWCAERTVARLLLWKPSLIAVPGGHNFIPIEPGLQQLAFMPADPSKPDERDIDGWDVHFETKLTLTPDSTL